MKRIEDYVISIPDFPEPGIIFRDVTSVLQDADGLRLAIDLIQEKLKGLEFDLIAGSESRGLSMELRSHTICINHSSRSGRKGSCPERLCLSSMSWSMGLQNWRCIAML